MKGLAGSDSASEYKPCKGLLAAVSLLWKGLLAAVLVSTGSAVAFGNCVAGSGVSVERKRCRFCAVAFGNCVAFVKGLVGSGVTGKGLLAVMSVSTRSWRRC